MAAVNAFNQALTRVGFNVDTTEAIIDEGFDTLETLATVDEKDIDLMIKNVRDTRRELGPGAEGAVTFPFLAIKRLKAMRFWVTELVRTGRQLNAGLFNGAEINLAVQRYSTEGEPRSRKMRIQINLVNCQISPSGKFSGSDGAHMPAGSEEQPSAR
jgi:hypothetical protein